MAKKDSFGEFVGLEEYATPEEISHIKSELVCCPDINNMYSGTVIELGKNYAKSIFMTTIDMVVDEHGLIFDAFVFSAANYVAQASINKEYAVLIASKCFFYAPLKLGDVLELEAHAMFDDTSKKRDIRVVGQVKDIKIFEATIQAISTDEHIFKLKRPPSAAKPATENAEGAPNAAAPAAPDAIAAAMSTMIK